VSSFLFLIGVLTVVRSHFVDPVPLDYSVKNIAIILLSLVGFAVISQYINMILGIIFWCSAPPSPAPRIPWCATSRSPRA
jgi:hypothetical protein